MDIMRDYGKLIWWHANRFARKFGGRGEDYVGTIYLRAIEAQRTWDSDKGSNFSTYLGRGMYGRVKQWLRHESETWSVHFSDATQDDVEVQMNFASHIADGLLWEPKRDDEWAIGIVECFDDADACWEFLTRGLDDRDKFMLRERCALDRTFEAIGESLGVSKQRALQIYDRALFRLKKRAEEIEMFASLFVKEVP